LEKLRINILTYVMFTFWSYKKKILCNTWT
jgi:hypothetical protein